MIRVFTIFCLLLLSSNAFANFAWYDGSVEDAFKTAKTSNKSLFLYWGAVWCPPCNQMKKTVFTRPEFAQAMKSYVAVYLDGDTARAQTWGEQLKALGYPTMLLMDPNGRELMRMPTGLTADQYIKLLNQAAQVGKNIDELAKRGLTGKASAEEWQLIAGYSWVQHPDQALAKASVTKLWNKAPTQELKARLLIQLLGDYDPQAYTRPMKDLLSVVVKDQGLALQNMEYLAFSISKLIKEKFKPEEALPLKENLLATLTELRKKDLTLAQRLQSYYPSVLFEVPGIAATIKEEVKNTDAKATDPHDRQSAMSDAIYLLIEVGELDLAHQYAAKELKRSGSPFYFMSYLGNIEQKRNNPATAVDWHRKAWQGAVGDASIFQWGTSYLIQSMKLTPKSPQIASDLQTILGKMLKQDDVFHGRNLKRVERLSTEFKNWSKNQKTQVPDLCKGAIDVKQCRQWF